MSDLNPAATPTAPGGAGATGRLPGGTGPAATATQGLDRDAFLKLLVAQMRFQDPLAPVDGKEYMAQLAQFAAVERLESLARAQTEMIGFQRASLSAALVGRTVTAETSRGPVTGTVEAVRYGAAGTRVVIGGTEVPLDDVVEVRAGTPPVS